MNVIPQRACAEPVPASKLRRSCKGSVKVESFKDRLRLRWSWAEKRYCMSLGLPDTNTNRKLAQMKAHAIELDIASGNFDETLEKYQNKSKIESQKSKVKEIQTPDLAEIWEKFVEHKRHMCSPNTMLYVYGYFSKYIDKLPTKDLTQAGEIRDFAIANFPIESTRRFLTRLSACCDWAISSGKITANPFKGMAQKIHAPKSTKQNDEYDIHPFSARERDRIIDAIAKNSFCNKHSAYPHSYYAPYVRFCFFVGCRPSEAIALQWKHVAPGNTQILFEQAAIVSKTGKIIRQGLKSQQRRKFPCNHQVREILAGVKPEYDAGESLVFPGVTGGLLDTASFRKNVWKPVLEGLGIEYRKPYQMRHTFITLTLEAGLDVKDVARLAGNSPEVIYRHYAGVKRDLFVPEI